MVEGVSKFNRSPGVHIKLGIWLLNKSSVLIAGRIGWLGVVFQSGLSYFVVGFVVVVIARGRDGWLRVDILH